MAELPLASAVPTDEQDIHAWATDYVAQQKQRMQASARTGRPEKPSRAEVTRAVRARFGVGGRAFGPLTWLRIAYWVAMILLAL